MEKEELEKSFLLDALWQLEYAEGQLRETIDFLYCIDDEYFERKKDTGEQWLRWQLSSIIRTLRKSIESTQMNMQKSIETIYEEKRLKNNTN